MGVSRHDLRASISIRRVKSSKHWVHVPSNSISQRGPSACSHLSLPHAGHLPPSLFATYPMGPVLCGRSRLHRPAPPTATPRASGSATRPSTLSNARVSPSVVLPRGFSPQTDLAYGSWRGRRQDKAGMIAGLSPPVHRYLAAFLPDAVTR